MSSNFYIDTEKVVAVLLTDGWHDVASGSFSVGPYKFIAGRVAVGESRGGFSFREGGSVIAGPLESVLAVKQKADHDGL